MKRLTEKITRDLLAKKTVLFFPQTEEESAYIQEKLFELDIVWAEGQTYPILLGKTVDHCISVSGGEIRTACEIGSAEVYLGTHDDFECAPEPKKFISVETKWLAENFNRVLADIRTANEKMAAIDNKIDDIANPAPKEKFVRKPK